MLPVPVLLIQDWDDDGERAANDGGHFFGHGENEEDDYAVWN